MTSPSTPTPCTIPIAYLGGFEINDYYVTGQPSDPQGLQAIAARDGFVCHSGNLGDSDA